MLHHRMFSLTAALALALLFCSGCPKPPTIDPGTQLTAPRGSISVFQLAGALGMDVVASSPNGATLRDPANTVMIYPDPDGQAYVNGAPVGRPGGMKIVGDTLFVPQRTLDAIRPALTRVAKRTPPPAQRQPVQRQQPISKFARVVVDPGHGGDDPGAPSVAGGREKTIVLAAGASLAAALRGSGVDALMTRDNDRFISLNDRADFSNRSKADAFVSVHADAAANASAHGFTVYVARSASAQSTRLAKAIERRLVGLGISSRGVRQADYRVLVRTNCPAVLVELGYLSNRGEAARLGQAGYRNKLSGAIAQGVLDFLRGR